MLPAIMDGAWLPESVFWREFEEARARILGGLLDALVVALKNEPTVELDRHPRMADFAVWACAGAPGFGWTPTSSSPPTSATAAT